MDWTVRALEESQTILSNWRGRLLNSHMAFIEQNRDLYASYDVDPTVVAALQDDLNTAEAIAALHQLARHPGASGPEALFASLRLLGLTSFDDMARQEHVESFGTGNFAISRSLLEEWIDARRAARAAKNFAESDRIRDELAAMGIALKDNKDGTTTWEVVR
jgi:cysteinyl-tRNA synthetase